ncbi:MAG: hypothetical protein LCI03_07305 [Actinobacteria bacterium]|nr:hypothetical protein [Actinomycetota bacterium]
MRSAWIAAAGLTVLLAALPTTPSQAISAPEPPSGTGALGVPGPPPFRGQGFAIGDSVMMGARRCLEPKAWTVDAVGSRQADAVADNLWARRGHLPRVIVVHTGTNAGVDQRQFDRIMRVVGNRITVVWVTVQLPETPRYTREDSTNRVIRSSVPRHLNARLADWNAVSFPHRHQWMWGDGIHLTPAGCTAYARLVDRVARA